MVDNYQSLNDWMNKHTPDTDDTLDFLVEAHTGPFIYFFKQA